ncbi:MAG: hypothetical protein ACI4J7_08420 [Ruminiclostridium sp.]
MAVKEIEWKETRFPFSIEYDLSLFVRNRCVLFHCLSRNIRKTINYVARLSSPYQICVIYVYGAVKAATVQSILDKAPNNIMCLIASAVTAEDLKALADHRKWLDNLKGRGLLKIINPGHRKSEYSNTIVGVEYGDEPSEHWYKTYNQPQCKELYSYYLDGIAIMRNSKEASERISNVLTSDLDVLANFPAGKKSISGAVDMHNSELLEIIRRLYPYGVESDTSDEYAVKMLKAKKIVSAVVNNEQSKDIDKLSIHFSSAGGQICFWDNTTFGADQCVDWLSSKISNALAEKGCINLSHLWAEFSKPPYGAYPSNWYNYLFAVSIKKCYKDGMFFGDSLQSYPIKLPSLASAISNKFGFLFQQNEKQDEFRRLFAKLFDLIPEETTQGVITQVRSWTTANLMYTPLDWIDHNFHNILCGGDEIFKERSWEKRQQIWYEFGYEAKYLPWLKENFPVLYRRVRTADKDFKQVLAAEYGEQKAELYCKFHTIKGSAVGWLHRTEIVKEQVMRYMKVTVCSECGKPICPEGLNPQYAYEHFEYDPITHKSKTFDFSEKDILGINKKLLGRNTTNCFCINCLCEVAETTPTHLWEMIRDFKEQGCTLFQ